MAQRNIVAGLALIAFGAWYAYLIGNLPERSIMPNTPGPSFFPTVIVSLVLVLSVALLVTGFRQLHKEPTAAHDTFAGRPMALALAAFTAYLAALPYAGFIAASVVFFAALMHLYGCRSTLMIGSASFAIPVILFVIFRYAFQIVLPRGILDF